MGLTGALAHLRCPVCAAPLTLKDRVVRCANGHAFDVARHGYVNLAPGGGPPLRGDTAEMVAARAAFLGAGHFDPIADAVALEAAAASATVGGCVVDLGAGTGYYLARALGRTEDRAGLALDASRFALRRAARTHPRIGAVACDAWRPLPLRDATAAVVLSVFAPRDPAEIARVLAVGGALVLVTPTRRHLGELVDALGLLTVDERKAERVATTVGAVLHPLRETVLETPLDLDHASARSAARMGPSTHHLDERAVDERLAGLGDRIATVASVSVSVFERR